MVKISLRVSMIIIGDELLNAKINDLNLQILAKEIAPLGFSFKKCTVLGDKFDQVTNEIQKQSKENDILIITGGLGPTKDDLTKSIIANALGVSLVENELAREYAIKQYANFGREWSKENSHYHMMPDLYHRKEQVLKPLLDLQVLEVKRQGHQEGLILG
mgnify:CR=1 FL=1